MHGILANDLHRCDIRTQFGSWASRLMGLDPQADRDKVHESVGVQLQDSSLPAKLRVCEILDVYQSFYREPAGVTELIEVLGLESKRKDYYRSLSGGQRQLLSVVLALIGQPKIAVLDEMTTGLDPQGPPGHPGTSSSACATAG